LRRVCVRPENGKPTDQIAMDMPLLIEIEFWNLVPGSRLHITLHFYNDQQIVAFTTGSVEKDQKWSGYLLPGGLFCSTCKIPANFLNSGIHRILLLVVQDGSKVIYRYEDIISFDVLDLTPRKDAWYGKEPGAVRPILEWTTEYIVGL
jgi:lipopolysaccharide transport system ATP-binding protein